MKLRTLLAGKRLCWTTAVLAATLLSACSTTSSVNWDDRIGNYSWEDAVAEFGNPDRVADLDGGVKAAEWIRQRSTGFTSAADTPSYVRGEPLTPTQTYGSSAPAKVLRLSFTPDGKLFDWERNY